MDNYTELLQEFHLHQQQHTISHEVQIVIRLQFIQLIDFIRNQKQLKQSIIIRKKQQRVKLLQKISKHKENTEITTPKISTKFLNYQKEHNLQQINNIILKKQHQEIQKQVCKIRKVVKQMEDQLAVFIRKDNSIKQLQYSSRRQYQNASLQIKNQKTIIQQMQEKHERLIEQLNIQKYTLQHQNRYLANQLKQLKCLTKNMKVGIQSDLLTLSQQNYKIQEVYTKKKLESNLRSFFVVVNLKNYWDSQETDQKRCYTQLIQDIIEKLNSQQYFFFISKYQLFKYYLSKFNIESFKSIAKIIIQLYKSMMTSINKYESIGNHLNNKIIELRVENERLQKFLGNLQEDTHKNTINLIAQVDRELFQRKQNIKIRSRSIFQIIERQFKLFDKLKRITTTLQFIIYNRSQSNIQKQFNSSFQFKFNKKFVINTVQKQESVRRQPLKHSQILQRISASNQRQSIQDQNFDKNSQNLLCKNIQLYQFQNIMYKNPVQAVVQWYSFVKNGRDGANFLQTILNNDLYRIFFECSQYDNSKSQLQNQVGCYTKVYQSVSTFILCLKNNLKELIKNMDQECKNLCQKNKNIITESLTATNSPRYIIESKGFYRRDNFKILQKLQNIQLKRQGLFIPFRYGIDVQKQMISQRATVKQVKPSVYDKNRCTSFRKPRSSVPNLANYVSNYRQKLNKSNRKIRDLLANADSLRVKLKIKRQFSKHSPQKIIASRLK